MKKDIIASVNGLTVINYSEKAIAVTGETKAIKDTLKAMSGWFNKSLDMGDGTKFPGWIFKKDQLEAIVGLMGTLDKK